MASRWPAGETATTCVARPRTSALNRSRVHCTHGGRPWSSGVWGDSDLCHAIRVRTPSAQAIGIATLTLWKFPITASGEHCRTRRWKNL
jgi:hypothetical protein